MALSSETMYEMVGRVQAGRPGLGDSRYRQLINDAVRWTINKRPYWTDLRKTGVVSVPDQTNAGTIATTRGSNIILGTGTGWPTNDVVNTTLAEPVVNPGGFDKVALTSVTGLQPDGVLLIDQGTPSQEYCPVYLVDGFSITSRFQFPHNVGATVTQSSLVGQQLRTGYEFPVFTVMAVPTPTTLLIDSPWGGPPLSSWAYYIVGIYYSVLASSSNQNIRKIVTCIDQQQGIPLNCQMTQEELNMMDPQRSDNSDPIAFVSRGPSAAGFMQWEIYPAPTSSRQIAFLASLQWPKMIDDESLPPPFLEPTIFTNKAIALALLIKLNKDDIHHDPKLAMVYEKMAIDDLLQAMNSDEHLCVQDYTAQISNMLGPGTNSTFWLKHDPNQLSGMF